MQHLNGNKKTWERVFQQELAKLYSSRCENAKILELNPFMAVLRMVKVEFLDTKPELYHLLLRVLHDYNPADGQTAYKKTISYIEVILDSVPQLLDYVVSILPPPEASNAVKSHSLLQFVAACDSAMYTMECERSKGKQVSTTKGKTEDVVAELSTRGKTDTKFYNYTPPAVNAYVASRGVPTKVTTKVKFSGHPVWTVIPTTTRGIKSISEQVQTDDLSQTVNSTSAEITSLTGALNPKMVHARKFHFKCDSGAQPSKYISEKDARQATFSDHVNNHHESSGTTNPRGLLNTTKVSKPVTVSNATGLGKPIPTIAISKMIGHVAAIRNLATFPYTQQMLVSNGAMLDAIQCKTGNRSTAAVKNCNKTSENSSKTATSNTVATGEAQKYTETTVASNSAPSGEEAGRCKSSLVKLKTLAENHGNQTTAENIPSKFNKATKESVKKMNLDTRAALGRLSTIAEHIHPEVQLKRKEASPKRVTKAARVHVESPPSSCHLQKQKEELVKKNQSIVTGGETESHFDSIIVKNLTEAIINSIEQEGKNKLFSTEGFPSSVNKDDVAKGGNESGRGDPVHVETCHNNPSMCIGYGSKMSLGEPGMQKVSQNADEIQTEISEINLKKKWKFFKGGRKRKRAKSQTAEGKEGMDMEEAGKPKNPWPTNTHF